MLQKKIKQGAVFVAGVIVILVGVILLFIPGPGLLLIAAGIGILATEFDFAKQWVGWAKKQYQKQREKLKKKRHK